MINREYRGGKIINCAYRKHNSEMEILMQTLCFYEIGAATLIAEIGNSTASWIGVVPNVDQSVDKLYHCRILTRGSKIVMLILKQIAMQQPERKIAN